MDSSAIRIEPANGEHPLSVTDSNGQQMMADLDSILRQPAPGHPSKCRNRENT